MKPVFKIELDGKDITARLARHIISQSLSDKRGMKADDLTLTFEDTEQKLTLPAPGRKIKYWLGYEETGLVFKGVFVIDEIEHSGAPDRISVKATSADFTAGLKTKKETYYENTTLGDIISIIAGLHDLKQSVTDILAANSIDHLTQTNESDLNFLSRLAKDRGAFFAVKNETIIFCEESASKTASGLDLPPFPLDRRDTSGHRFTERTRKNKFTGAKAAWYQIPLSEKTWEIEGTDDQCKALSNMFPDADQAKAAAKSEYARLQRGELTMNINLSMGNPALIPETPVTLTGFKSNMTAVAWVIKSVNHTLDTNGLNTVIDLEQPSTKT